MRRITLNLFVFCLALLTATSVSANVIVPAVGGSESFVVSNGDIFTDNGGMESNYADCGCLTSSVLTASGQISLDFSAFEIFGNLDWVRIYDGSDNTSPLLYGTKDTDNGAGDIDLADFIASNGSSTITGSGNSLFIEFYATTIGSAPGFQALVAAAQEVCEITCPADIVVGNDAGQCGANVTVPSPIFNDDCIPAASVINEGIDACAEPAGWGIDDGTGDPGNGFSGVTSDGGGLGDAILYNATDVNGGSAATSNPGFIDCIAYVADDGPQSPDNVVGFGCIIVPVNLPAGFFSPSFSMNWENQTFGTSGQTFIDYWDGSAWVNVVTQISDGFGDVVGQALPDNSDLTIRFCYDDEGSFAWGSAFDNLEVLAVDPSGAPSALNDYNGTTDASDYYPVGTTTVTFSVPGQTASCSMTITVEDTEAPTLTCPGDATINLDAGECMQVYNFQTSATDNCPSTPFSQAGPFCEPCNDPTGGSALACAPFAENHIIQLVDIGTFTGTIAEMCYNQETFGNQPFATINLYADDGSGTVPFQGGGFTPIATQDYQTSVLDDGSCVCVPFDMPATADGSFTAVWVEVYTPGLTLNSRIVQTPATCDGSTASGNDTYIMAPACGLATPGTFAALGFVLDASFALILQPLEVTPEPDPAAPTGYNQYEDGDFLPIGFHCWQYVATDEAGNTATCEWCVTVKEYPTPISELFCGQSVNVSLDENCEAVVGADAVLEGGPYGCYDDYVVSIDGGDNFLDGSDVGNTYEVMVTDPETGNTCWGYITVEDKQIPELECASYEVACSENPLPGTLVNGVLDFEFSPGLPITGGVQTADLVVSTPADQIQDINVALDINHTWVGDLIVRITSPEGTQIELLNNMGGPGFGCAGDNLDITLDDEAANSYDDLDGTCNNAPAAEGSFQPLQALSAFDGENPNGTWVIEIEDTFAGDDGTLNNVTLEMKLPNSQLIEFPLPEGVTIVPPSGEGPFTVFGFDPCGPVTLSYEDIAQGGDYCSGDYADVIYRVWTAVDPSGNTATCQDTFNLTRVGIADVQAPPSYDGLDEFTLNCATPYSPFLPFGPDNWDANQNNYPDPAETGTPGGLCENIWYGYTDQVIEGCGLTVLRNWTIVDECTGEMTNVVQKIKVVDNHPPVIECVETINVSVNYNECVADVVVPELISNYDDCAGGAVDFEISVSAGTLNPYFAGAGYIINDLPVGVHTLTYTADDGCGNIAECITTIVVADDVAPVAICDVNTVVSLGSDGTALIYAETFDDNSYDNCGDVSLLVRRIRPNGGADRSCEFDNGNYRPYVSFCCDDLDRDDVMVEMLVTDESGNSNTCMVNVDVDDKLPPFIQAPNDVTVSCEFPFDVWTLEEAFGKVVIPQNGEVRETTIVDDPNGNGITEILDGYAADNCDVTVEELPFNDNDLECGQGRIVRVWRAEDQDGRRAQASQRITVVDFDPFYICDVEAKCTGAPSPSCSTTRYTEIDDANWPCDILIEVCTTDVMSLDPDQLAMSNMRNEITRQPVSQAAWPEVFDDNCSQIAIKYEDEVFTVVPDACFKILRHWSIIDWCQYDEDTGFGRWDYTQVIKVLDTEAPEFMACEDVTFCDTSAVNCTGFADLALQVMDCTPLDQLVATYRIDAFNDGLYDINGTGTDASGYYPFGTHKIQWFVEDLCGNTSTCEYLFTTEDCKKPSPVCINGLSSVVMPSSGAIGIWAVDFDASSFDNCDEDLEFRIYYEGMDASWYPDQSRDWQRPTPGTSGSDVLFYLPSEAIFTCDGIEDGVSETFVVEVYAIDDAGNWDFCTTYVIVDDNDDVCDDNGGGGDTTMPDSLVFIAGGLQNEVGEDVGNTEVSLLGGLGNQTQLNQMSEGTYQFNNLPMNYDWEISSYRNDDHKNGVTTYDIALIQRHILGLELLDSPYKLIAANANDDEDINILDVVDLRKLILGIFDELPSNTSWRFVDNAYTFPAGQVAPPRNYPEVISYVNVDVNMESADFMAVKIGDVSGDATPNDLLGAEVRSFPTNLTFNAADQAITEGQEVSIDITAENFEQILGYQFTLGFDNSAIEFVDVKAGALNVSENNFGLHLVDRGLITTSWNDVNGISVSNDEVLFTLVFNAKSDAQLSQLFNVNSAKTAAESYKVNGADMGVALAFGNIAEGSAFALYQNTPNPFNDVTVVEFSLPETAEATITVYDVTGKVVKVITDDFNAGMNRVTLKKDDLSASGVLYYQLDTEGYTATKKMIVVE